ncbi:hypothetical protein B0O99DRAFT_595085 [Bisporella sp. PMI_857]|nr:hypothetical protein B0O99DRAFT_595085 [Bisporella sp. PMI_857]
MAKLDLEEENRIRTVIAIIEKNPYVNRAKLCRIHRVHKGRRLKGVSNARTAGGHNKRLNTTQNEGFKRFISYLIKIGQNPTLNELRYEANWILQHSGDNHGVSTA